MDGFGEQNGVFCVPTKRPPGPTFNFPWVFSGRWLIFQDTSHQLPTIPMEGMHDWRGVSYSVQFVNCKGVGLFFGSECSVQAGGLIQTTFVPFPSYYVPRAVHVLTTLQKSNCDESAQNRIS